MTDRPDLSPQELDRLAEEARDRLFAEKRQRVARMMAGLPVEKGDPPELVAEIKRLERFADETRDRLHAEK